MNIEQVPVDIVGDHPHTGRRGTIEVIDGKVKVADGFGVRMVLVTFGLHDACFAEAKNIRQVKEAG